MRVPVQEKLSCVIPVSKTGSYGLHGHRPALGNLKAQSSPQQATLQELWRALQAGGRLWGAVTRLAAEQRGCPSSSQESPRTYAKTWIARAA